MVSTTELRQNLAEYIASAQYHAARVPIARNGKVVAVLIPVEDYEFLLAVDEAFDKPGAAEGFAETQRGGQFDLDDSMVNCE